MEICATTAWEEESDRQGLKAVKRWRGHPMVHTKRVQLAVRWLLALLAGEAGSAALERTLDWRVAHAPISLLVTADASPWGLGAVLSLVDGTPLEWLTSPVNEVDCAVLRIKFGDCSGQAVLEALALLVALRAWAPRWMGQRVRVHLRSDSTAALGALSKLASPTENVNTIAREVALDIAASTYGVEVATWGHVSGCLNDWADALSRLEAPEARVVPQALRSVSRAPLPKRSWLWWRARAGVAAHGAGLSSKGKTRTRNCGRKGATRQGSSTR